jgi:ribonuclease P protein component
MEPRAATPARRGVVARPGPAGWQRLVASLAFERVLSRPASARTAHFALHRELPTGQPTTSGQGVDNCLGTVHGSVDSPNGMRALGLVVPKRHARRAVTRALLKRQIREVARASGADLADGIWVVRLRAPFDRALFTSAASTPLRLAARAELRALFADRALPRRLPAPGPLAPSCP